MSFRYSFVRKLFSLVLLCVLFSNSFAYRGEEEESPWNNVSGQIVNDLTTAGISIGAALSGSVPLALTAGYISKYVTTYGISGIKSLIDILKGYPPQDLGEINISYIYLLNVKRNLYGLMINMRKQASVYRRENGLANEIEELHEQLIQDFESEQPHINGIDDSLVNYAYLDIAIDARQTIDINSYLSAQELKHTYQYLMMLYFDVIMVEQQLILGQNNLLVNQVVNTYKILERNPYISNAEKEYQLQLVTNIMLRFQTMMDKRRVVMHEALIQPLLDLQGDVDDLEDEIDRYRPATATDTEDEDYYGF